MILFHICFLYLIWLIRDDHLYTYGIEIFSSDELFKNSKSYLFNNLNLQNLSSLEFSKSSKHTEAISVQPTTFINKIDQIPISSFVLSIYGIQYESIYYNSNEYFIDKVSQFFSDARIKSSEFQIVNTDTEFSEENLYISINSSDIMNDTINYDDISVNSLSYDIALTFDSSINNASAILFYNDAVKFNETEFYLDMIYKNISSNYSEELEFDYSIVSSINIINFKKDNFSVSSVEEEFQSENQNTYPDVYITPSFKLLEEKTFITYPYLAQTEYSVMSVVLNSKYIAANEGNQYTSLQTQEKETIVNITDKCYNYTKSLTHEFSITFNFTEEYNNIYPLHYLQQYFNDTHSSLCVTAFIEGYPSVFSWTNISINEHKCNLTEIDLMWFKMVERNGNLKTDFVQLFLPKIQIINVQKRYIGICSEYKSSSILNIAIIIVLFALILLTLIIAVIYKKRILACKLKSKSASNKKCFLNSRPPIILTMEKE